MGRATTIWGLIGTHFISCILIKLNRDYSFIQEFSFGGGDESASQSYNKTPHASQKVLRSLRLHFRAILTKLVSNIDVLL